MKFSVRKPSAGVVLIATVTHAWAFEPIRSVRIESPPPPSVFQPDAMIRVGTSGPFTGNDIHNQTGVSQTATTTIARGATVTFAVRFQNDGNTTDSFLVKPGGTPSPRYTVSYWQNGKDVTPIVMAGKFSTGELSPGQTVSLVVKVFARMAANKGSVLRQPLIQVSQKSPDIKDTVVMRAKLDTD
jgi:plastocyanin